MRIIGLRTIFSRKRGSLILHVADRFALSHGTGFAEAIYNILTSDYSYRILFCNNTIMPPRLSYQTLCQFPAQLPTRPRVLVSALNWRREYAKHITAPRTAIVTGSARGM